MCREFIYRTSRRSAYNFWAIGVNPMADISHRVFAQLDLCMVEQQWQEFIIHSYSDRSEVLSSHHFVLFTHIRNDIPETQPRHKYPCSYNSACRDPDKAFAFPNEINHWMN